MKRWICLGLVCATSVVLAAQEVELGCKRLRVVLDERLSPEVVESEWGSGNPRSEASATLELVGCAGEVLDRFPLETPLARLDPVPVRGAPHPTYLVSTDLTVEAGSYNGPLTIPVQVVRDHLQAAVARSADKRIEPIRLTLTGKSAWKRIANGRVDDLLLVSCQPAGRGFVTSYRRFHPSAQGWRVKLRTLEGLWESDGKFPERNRFP
ncbi:hypothetical protein [Rhodocyclus purpureus]|uniref:hypothetical protein n=1 Tax=Rhodocyclus purpureus TaxID=1067 RepID=UPI00191165FB|nr:hypothetical protein [Rhodocyclus purpureus]